MPRNRKQQKKKQRSLTSSSNSSTSSNSSAACGTLLNDLPPSSHPTISVGVHSEQGGRPYQEDRGEVVIMSSNDDKMRAFGAIYDGHGGDKTSIYLREHFRKSLIEPISINHCEPMKQLDDDLEEKVRRNRCDHIVRLTKKAIRKAFMDVEKSLMNHLRLPTGTIRDRSGSTCVCVFILDDWSLYCCNVGDSRAVLCRSGKAVHLSYDHTIQKNTNEKKRVQASNITVQDDRVGGILGLTRTFGDFELKKNIVLEDNVVAPIAEIRHLLLSETDEFIVIASDGLFDVMNSSEVVNSVRALIKKHEKCGCDSMCECIAAEICAQALERKTADNVTCVLISLNV